MKIILLLTQFLFVPFAFSQSGLTFTDCLGNVATQGKINFVVKTSSRQLRHDLNHIGLTILSYQQNVIATKSTHHQPSDFVNGQGEINHELVDEYEANIAAILKNYPVIIRTECPLPPLGVRPGFELRTSLRSPFRNHQQFLLSFLPDL